MGDNICFSCQGLSCWDLLSNSAMPVCEEVNDGVYKALRDALQSFSRRAFVICASLIFASLLWIRDIFRWYRSQRHHGSGQPLLEACSTESLHNSQASWVK